MQLLVMLFICFLGGVVAMAGKSHSETLNKKPSQNEPNAIAFKGPDCVPVGNSVPRSVNNRALFVYHYRGDLGEHGGWVFSKDDPTFKLGVVRTRFELGAEYYEGYCPVDITRTENSAGANVIVELSENGGGVPWSVEKIGGTYYVKIYRQQTKYHTWTRARLEREGRAIWNRIFELSEI